MPMTRDIPKDLRAPCPLPARPLPDHPGVSVKVIEIVTQAVITTGIADVKGFH